MSNKQKFLVIILVLGLFIFAFFWNKERNSFESYQDTIYQQQLIKLTYIFNDISNVLPLYEQISSEEEREMFQLLLNRSKADIRWSFDNIELIDSPGLYEKDSIKNREMRILLQEISLNINYFKDIDVNSEKVELAHSLFVNKRDELIDLVYEDLSYQRRIHKQLP
ncbi:hypothetical protein [Desertibacillus haloalkaliphilus]|uniref:hypothetical protein n=1 Tax=Desertibacillus haloalkaliphilus TaxID=1328930 RepID=UPI001C27B2F4|nr:hypothetical protein [Desertibacillus haloalkaliphilus]MBU8907475.1 hypothetical protein [Desertibacillus haloalkaliphilus]